MKKKTQLQSMETENKVITKELSPKMFEQFRIMTVRAIKFDLGDKKTIERARESIKFMSQTQLMNMKQVDVALDDVALAEMIIESTKDPLKREKKLLGQMFGIAKEGGE